MHGDAQPQRRIKSGIRLNVDRVSVCSVRVVEPPVYKGPGFVHGDQAFNRVHYIPRIMFRWYIKRNRRFVRFRQVPLRPAYAMMCNKSQGKAMKKVALDLTLAAFGMAGCMFPWAARECKLYVSLPQCWQEVKFAYVTIVNVVERADMEAAMP